MVRGEAASYQPAIKVILLMTKASPETVQEASTMNFPIWKTLSLRRVCARNWEQRPNQSWISSCSVALGREKKLVPPGTLERMKELEKAVPMGITVADDRYFFKPAIFWGGSSEMRSFVFSFLRQGFSVLLWLWDSFCRPGWPPTLRDPPACASLVPPPPSFNWYS